MKVELIYFDLQGRATQARIMLKMAGIDFIDTRLSKEEFGEKKPSFEDSALGQLPVLKVDDKETDSVNQNVIFYSTILTVVHHWHAILNSLKVYCQSDAIMEWAADKAGLIPKNDDDAMAMRMVIGKIHLSKLISFEPGNFFLKPNFQKQSKKQVFMHLVQS